MGAGAVQTVLTVSRIAIIGRQDSGKTTWTARILAHWAETGVRAAVIKHDGHASGAGPDVLSRWQKRGSDTDRLLRAGASAAAVIGGSAAMFLLPEDPAAQDPDQVALRLVRWSAAAGAPLDAVVLEGGKRTDWPKLAVMRSAADADWLVDELVAGRIRTIWGAACSNEIGKAEAARRLAGQVSRVYDELDLAELCEKLRTDPQLRWQTGAWNP